MFSQKKFLSELLFISLICAALAIIVAVSYRNVITWRVLYRAVQAASEMDASVRLPLACAQGPISDNALRDDLHAALQVYEQSSSVQSSSIITLAGQAYCWIGDYIHARETFELALQKKREDTLVAIQLIALYQKTDDTSALQDLLSRKVLSPRVLLSIADNYLFQKDYQSAINWYRHLLFVEPSSQVAWGRWFSVGAKYEQQKEWQQSIFVYQSALEYQDQLGYAPYHASFLLKMGINLERLGDVASYERAGAFYDQAVADGRFINTTDLISAHQYRGDWRRDHREDYAVDDYLSDYQSMLNLDPGSIFALLRTGQVYLEEYQDSGTAKKYFEQLTQVDPKSANGFYYLGQACFNLNDFTCALQAYQAAVDLNPQWKAAINRLAETKKRMGELP